MKIRTLKTIQVGNNNVYIRNFGDVFEYLIVLNKEIFAAHIIVKKRPWWFRGYPKKVEQGAIKILLNMAETTIETVKIMKNKEQKESEKLNHE
ncbi:MAG: hypothetical protein WC900_08680 [Oscillospiraceae bacterium]|jgi:hypothetical protein